MFDSILHLFLDFVTFLVFCSSLPDKTIWALVVDSLPISRICSNSWRRWVSFCSTLDWFFDSLRPKVKMISLQQGKCCVTDGDLDVFSICVNISRVVMAIDLEIWWLRSLSFIIVVPFLGPHLVAIAKMVSSHSSAIMIVFISSFCFLVERSFVLHMHHRCCDGWIWYRITIDGLLFTSWYLRHW